MSREIQVRFCESRGVKFPPATHLLVHCTTRAQAQVVLAGIEQRLRDLGMAVHPDKTKIVYCKDGKRRGRFPVVSFTFLGFMFCPRPSRNRRGEQFLAFLPAISPQALKRSAGWSVAGGCTGGSSPPSTSWPARSTRSSRGGCSTTGGSTAPSCLRSWRASTLTWCAGSATSTDGWTQLGSHTGSSPSWPLASRGCSGTGPGSPAPGDEDDVIL